jgi:hypothetical protein
MVAFAVSSAAYTCERCEIRWTVFDAETKEPLQDSRYVEQMNWPDAEFVSQQGQDQTIRSWVPIPRPDGTYYIQFELYDDEGNLIPPPAKTQSFAGAST